MDSMLSAQHHIKCGNAQKEKCCGCKTRSKRWKGHGHETYSRATRGAGPKGRSGSLGSSEQSGRFGWSVRLQPLAFHGSSIQDRPTGATRNCGPTDVAFFGEGRKRAAAIQEILSRTAIRQYRRRQ